MLYVQLYQSVHQIGYQNGNEASSFGVSVNNYPYRIMIRGTFRQSRHEIHRDLRSLPLWDL